jgi:glycosyltransferase involved in cell wall biosynthesis
MVGALARGLAGLGHSVTIVTTHTPGNFHDSAVDAGWPVEDLARGETRLKARVLRLASWLNENADVVLSNHSTESLCALPLLSPEMRFVAIQHSPSARSTSALAPFAPGFDAWVCVSPPMRDAAAPVCAADRLRTVPNGVPARALARPAPEAGVHLLFAGRLDQRSKRIYLLPDLCRLLLARGLPVHCHVAGDGPDAQGLRSRVAKRKLDSAFTFHGQLTTDQVADLMGRSSWLVLPSPSEGLPLAVIEAMSVGLPPVVSDIPTLRWLLGPHADALAAPSLSAEAFADALFRLERAPENVSALRSALHRRQREHFSEGAMVRAYDELLRELSGTEPARHRDIRLPRLLRLRQTRPYEALQRLRHRSNGRSAPAPSNGHPQ